MLTITTFQYMYDKINLKTNYYIRSVSPYNVLMQWFYVSEYFKIFFMVQSLMDVKVVGVISRG